jgi:GWxTD domain-containing protein
VASGTEFAGDVELRVPAFSIPAITAPIIVYRAEPRDSRSTPPTFILSPRATVELDSVDAHIYAEVLSAEDRAIILEAWQDGEVIWSDTLAPPAAEGPLRSVLAPLEANRLAPGTVSLQMRLEGTPAADSTTLVVALMPNWLAIDYEGALSYLRYAGTPEALDSLHSASVRERAGRLHALWRERDPDPGTVENEFFEAYFRRIRDANARFSEISSPGWLTDRGAVYVTLGPPDEVLRDLDARQGPEQSQVWLYKEALGFELRLVFTDPGGTGAFSLTADSRRAFAEAVETLYSSAAAPRSESR